MNNEENQQKWVKKCEEILKMGGKSERTIVNYKSAWNKLFKYFPENTYISKLKEEDLLVYFKNNFFNNNLASSSYNVNLCAIRFLFSVCFKKEFNRTLLPSSRLQKRFPIIISKEEFIRIFNLEKNTNHKCWLLLSFCSGLRSSDISNIKIENIDVNNHKLKILGKRNKERFTILPDITIKYLRLYCRERNITNKFGYLFKGYANKDHINPRTVTNYFINIKDEFNIPKEITEHSLRHSFATYYLMNEGDLFTLQSMLGHKSLATTSIYLHLAHDFNKLKGIKYDRR